MQGRTYANLFGLIERYINAKVLELGRHIAWAIRSRSRRWCSFIDEELKHQELFRRIEEMIAPGMPRATRFDPRPGRRRRVEPAPPGRCWR